MSWIFLNLAVMILAIGFVYSHLFGQDLGSFIPYLTVGLIAWGYLTNSIVEGGNAFTSSEGYIKQISLPLYIYVMRFFVSIGLTSAITWVAYGLVALVYRVPVSAGTLWALPGLLLLMVTSLLLITIFAHLNARFRDAAHLAAVVMQVLFYVTPVIYPASKVPEQWRLVYGLNPMVGVVTGFRWALLGGSGIDPSDHPGPMVWMSCVTMLVLLIGGLFYFRRMEKTFADVV